MKITISQSTLQKQLELVGKIATKHVTLPVLQCVVFDVTDSEVKIRATNLEIAVEVNLENIQIEAPGKVAVPAQTLLQTIQFLNEKTVTLSVDTEGVLEIATAKTTTTIKSIPPDEFPTIAKVAGTSVQVMRQQFLLGIKTAAFAASQSSIKPELGSVYIHQKKEHTLTFVATDSFRLMEKTVSQKSLIFDTSILVPFKNALELARMCEMLDSDPELIVADNQCALSFSEGVYITTRLVAGSFPDYESIIPKEYTTHTTVLKQDMQTAFKKTNVFLNKFRQVKLAVAATSLEISSQNNDVGTVVDVISAQTEGDDLALSFNQQYIQDPLQHINDESIVMHFAGIGRPLVMQGVSDATLRYLVMPMNK